MGNMGYSTRQPREESIYNNECAVLHALELIGGKWKLPILWYLSESERVRYNELKRRVVGITNMMLTKCLKELEASDLVRRVEYPEIPPRVEYSLTEDGKKLLPALRKLHAWGRNRLDKEKSHNT